MIEFLSTTPGVVACRLNRRIEPEDTDQLTHELQLAFENDGPVNLYYELDKDIEMSVRAIVHGLRNALDIFVRRDQLGRVAIVSDDTLMRALSKAESALLPGISYELFHQDQCYLAREWIEGSSALPRGQTVEILETDCDTIVGFVVDGKIAAEELHAIAAELNKRHKSAPPEGMILILRNYAGFEPSGAFHMDYIRMKLAMFSDLKKYAVVGAPKWMEKWITTLQPLIKMEIRTFELGQEDYAWAWLGAEPREKHPIIEPLIASS
ncbi:hypothetical protein EH31_01435 [Erythrobacter longus]|uniref:STAS/SEC14 domain-containing protein n=1 Tax=Erythrobacter longus TaxID=1044 RepID=A0A074MCZ9_ERYLO|nr:STAS/SEC14 domain-containing protein [Erythrobacter longus]KEO91354.1 hypothetical protein EH31_01435 [Erythrobacter longus]